MFKELFESGPTFIGGLASKMDKIRALVDEYDFFTDYIDSYAQKKKKDRRNKDIIAELSKYGVSEIANGKTLIKIPKR